MKQSGFADLPLHYGRVPPWLANRMATLGRAIIESIVLEYGKKEVLIRLSDPAWFQSLGCVLGMDWHSSGITTSVMGALKKSINPISKDLGIYICGGRGKHSRKTPQELMQVAEKTGLNGVELARSSRLSAKVDNTAIQDGFQIYLHNFILTDEGDWTVVQQGMNKNNGMARRYHWHSEQFQSFVEEPHTYIYGRRHAAPILNLTSGEAKATKKGILELTTESPDKIMKEIRKIIVLPGHHEVQAKDVNMKRLGSILALAQNTEVTDFESMLLLQGLGPRTLQSLTLVSEVIHGTPSRFDDPARYSFAHGGKDGHPFPVPLKIYDRTIKTLKTAVYKAKLGHSDKQMAIKNLHKAALRIEEHFIPNNNFDELIAHERGMAPVYGGRTVFDDRKDTKRRKKKVGSQLRLF